MLSAVQVGIDEISAWCSRNTDQSEMILSRRKFIGPMKAVELENVIKVVNESKYLGVTMESKLKWKTQVNKCRILNEFQNKANKTLQITITTDFGKKTW